MADNIVSRARAYADAYGLNSEAMQLGTPDAIVRADGLRGDPLLRSHCDDLEAALQHRSAEEDQLRSELLERQRAHNEEMLLKQDVDILKARQDAFAGEASHASGTLSIKGEQLQSQLQQVETLLAATSSLSATLEKDRANNHLIEEQRRRPVHYMEHELMLPLGHAAPTDADMECDDDSQ